MVFHYLNRRAEVVLVAVHPNLEGFALAFADFFLFRFHAVFAQNVHYLVRFGFEFDGLHFFSQRTAAQKQNRQQDAENQLFDKPLTLEKSYLH
jgi:hypothetical protein